MATTYYDTVNGQIVGGTIPSSGTSFALMPDALGSTRTKAYWVAGSVTSDEATYAPYGAVTSGGVGSFGWNGGNGYRATDLQYAEYYVRARTYSDSILRWTTKDPLWPRGSAYGFANQSPVSVTDYSGKWPLYLLLLTPYSAEKSCHCNNPVGHVAIDVPNPKATLVPPLPGVRIYGRSNRQGCYDKACKQYCDLIASIDNVMNSYLHDCRATKGDDALTTVRMTFSLNKILTNVSFDQSGHSPCEEDREVHKACSDDFEVDAHGNISSLPRRPQNKYVLGDSDWWMCNVECELRVCCAFGILRKKASAAWSSLFSSCNNIYRY